MKTRAVLIVSVLALSSTTAGAQGFGNDCTPAGTWYGGDEGVSAKYVMVVTPTRAGEFSLRFVQGFTPRVPRISEFSGQILTTKGGGWEGYVIALVNNDLTPPPAAPAPDIRAAHVKIEFDGCDKLTSTIDFYALYKWGHVPFVDGDFTNLFKPGQTEIVESYYRVPMECPYCPLP